MNDILPQIGRRQQLLAVLLALCVVGALTVGVGGAIAQDDDDSPPPLPAAYYGEITIDGEPAPAGVEVTAEIDGDERGSIVTEQEGSYGGPSALDPKLTVEGTEDDTGAAVEFFVDGDPADTDTEVEWESGVNQEVNLTVDTDDESGAGGGGAGGGTGGGTGADDSDGTTDDTDETADDDSTDADDDSTDADDDTDAATDDDADDAGVDDDADTADGDTDDNTPGFTSLTALIAVSALLIFGYLTRRHR